jgi:hypothetical protein
MAAGVEAGAAPAADGGASVGHLVVTTAFVPDVAYPAGTNGIPVSGRATSDAVAVGVRFADMGSGYWVVPLGVVNQNFPGENDFGMNMAFNPGDPPGHHDLAFVALDSAGNAGNQHVTPVCIDTALPDNQHACFPANTPPSTVISLVWDANFDLDLHVVTPEGVDINAKTRPNLGSDGGATTPATAARIDRDSLDHCIPDGFREEDVSWPPSRTPGMANLPTKGVYLIYVDPFAACGQPSVRFTVTLSTLQGTCPDCRLVAHKPVSGELISSQVTGGSSPPTFVTQYSL